MAQPPKPGIAVVTGASSGIGAAYANQLANRGFDLLLVARRADRLSAAAANLEQRHGVKVETLVADLEKSADVATLERYILDQPVSLLVNNAGTGALGPTATGGADRQEKLISLNIVALTRLSLAALERFRAAGSGTLVNIASVIAFAPTASGAAYSGSKAYVLNFTRSLQAEYAKSKIRIQAVLPGPIKTEFFSSQGVSEDIFPESSFLTAEQLVDASLAGLDAGEEITIPSLSDIQVWEGMEALRQGFMRASLSGKVADRYV